MARLTSGAKEVSILHIAFYSLTLHFIVKGHECQKYAESYFALVFPGLGHDLVKEEGSLVLG